jgi:transcriptional regulator with XRE-family HTH domain
MTKIVHSTRIPNNIRRIRQSRHLIIKEVAILMGLKSAAHISHWEKGRKLPSLVNYLRLAAVLRIQPEFLFRELYNQIRGEVQDLKNKYNIHEKYD